MTWRHWKRGDPNHLCAGGCGRPVESPSAAAKCPDCRKSRPRPDRALSYQDRMSRDEMEKFDLACQHDAERAKAYRDRLTIDPEKVWE